MKKNIESKKGISILGVLLFGVILILILSYFNVSIKAVVESPTGQENVGYISGGIRNLWNDYLAGPVGYLWNDIWLNIFWKSFVSNMERIRDGLPTDFDKAAENLKITQ